MTTPHLSSDWASSTIDTHRIDETDPQSMALLKAAFEGVYAPLFTEENGGERLDQWEARLRDYTRKTRYVIIVAGKNLLHAEGQRNIMGLAVGIYYKEADVGLLAYNAVSPAARNQGIGKTLLKARMQSLVDEAAKHNKPLRAIVYECNNPELVSPEEDMFDPRVRLATYKGWGAREIDMDYVSPQDDKIRNMLLMSLPHPQTGQYATASDVTAFLNGFYKIFGYADPTQDPDYKNMVRQLEERSARKGSIIKMEATDSGFQATPPRPL